ncbi:1,4-alpha-glucan branching enzyme GlgB [Posidoniimonas corsicana]|uniref:1,4-alpha-glucan branching enzyme n=1 Tax=Posidoniimonas corsicana TaxID=1938618 RepID=A0A5C5VI93_9BACT|nr:alpha-amylase family glycosyl hydrolase [Posidoniimonas corsicana]TWT37589.1 1,4-alpha-glucan branching enzyme GlgB [Posidoniimonas corsicana]
MTRLLSDPPASPAPPAAPLPGMGSLPHPNGVAFRVWAPNAEAVFIVGDFNSWVEDATPMSREESGTWYADCPDSKPGDEYRYLIINGDQRLSRIDPYAREVTNSVGNGVIYADEFDWEGDSFELANFNELVIYEMHIGTFNATKDGVPGTFDEAAKKLAYLAKLGVNAVQLMPLAEFAGDYSWGYNPAQIYAVESAYGGPDGLKKFVKLAHQHGIGVILDVVYNHFGPSDLSIWQFDGWSENGKGGIYFYNDWRSKTPWGDTRPDYGRGEVRAFIHDNARMWLRDFHMDGLRYDMTLYIRTVDGGSDIPEGWSLAQWVNSTLAQEFPRAITIAEDLQNNDWLTKPPEWGGAGFSSQWDAGFVHPVRDVVQATNDADRSMGKICGALLHRYNFDAFERVIYSESHDEVANGKQRVPSEISPDDPTSLFAQKRSTLAAVLMFTAPGVPMLFQGQEFLRDGWFDDGRPIDWDQAQEFRGIVRMYRDLIRLRLNRDGVSSGLIGQHIALTHVNDAEKVIAFTRWSGDHAGSRVLVVLNFANKEWTDYRIGFPGPGPWRLRFNSDARVYSEDFDDTPAEDVLPEEHGWDGLSHSSALPLAPYSALIYSTD